MNVVESEKVIDFDWFSQGTPELSGVECNLAKVEVVSSNLITRSNFLSDNR
tara:strand:- start:111 stop:263 length:153 start_codon:yes stop_codon:yes gene_type:complete